MSYGNVFQLKKNIFDMFVRFCDPTVVALNTYRCDII
jgi:hypothetical protein